MLRSSEYISQNYVQTNEKLIMNPFQLFIYELQTKDITTKKTSIETVHIIALAMEQKQIVKQLLPFLVKLLVQQSSKDIKATIVKSLKNLLPLLNKQSSYLNFIQILIDIVLVFDEVDIKSEALATLGIVLLDQNVLNFQTFKQPFKSLIISQLSSINQPSNGKNAKEISFYLIKYLFKHQQSLKQDEILQLVKFLRQNFLQSTQNDYFNLKLLSENFHMFVEVWPYKFIKQMYTFIDFFMNKKQIKEGVENAQQKQSQNEKIKSIPQQVLTQLKINIISTLLNLSKKIDQSKAFEYIQILLKQQDSKIKISLIKKTKQIFQIFDKNNLQPLLNIFKNFADQPQDIKKAILQVIEEIPFDENEKKQVIFKVCKNTIDLKNILIQTLIRNNKTQSVSEILNQGDYDFKIKIFTKLPDSLLHKNNLYAEIVDSLLSQPKKNFRSKLNIVLNLISRIQEKSKTQKDFSQSFDISYMLSTLIKYFGDKIAIIRVNVAKFFALILFHFNVNFEEFQTKLNENFYGESKTWVEKQTVLIMIKEYLTLRKEKYLTQDNSKSLKANKFLNKEFQIFISNILNDSLNGFKNKDQTKNVPIANISNLAKQIITNFSIQI